MSTHPSRTQRQPRHDNDILICTYYYGVKCPHCKDMTPHILDAQDNMIGGRIDMIATDDVYEFPQMKHDRISRQIPDQVRRSQRQHMIEVTPTLHWEDGLVTEGLPYDDPHEPNDRELREYIARRSAKTYLKQTRPDLRHQEIEQIVDQVMDSRIVEDPVRGDRDPWSGLREITFRY